MDFVVKMFFGNWYVLNGSGYALCMCRKESDAATICSALLEREESPADSPASPAQQLNCAIAFIAKVAHARELPGGGGGCQECNIDALVDEAQEFLATQQHN
jgi:hypothetical protein